MGNIVYDCGNPAVEGKHLYCHSRKDGEPGYVYLVVNNSLTEETVIELPKEAEVYALAGRDGLRSSVMTLNGCDLIAGENGELPELKGVVTNGQVVVAPGSCTFIVV
ncbi:MAG: hypothetical protein IKM20_09000 [Erysipelotrichales bacterium]|nr:hypothetical protein [Erysipelotrichales bacterium]